MEMHTKQNYILELIEKLQKGASPLAALLSIKREIELDSFLRDICIEIGYDPSSNTFLKEPNISGMLNILQKHYSKFTIPTESSNLPSSFQVFPGKCHAPLSFDKTLKRLSEIVTEIIRANDMISYKEIYSHILKSYPVSERDKTSVLRRIYDVLNVLLAMKIVGVHCKKYFWKGLNTHLSSYIEQLKVKSIQNQQAQKRFRDLCARFNRLKKLIDRNKNLKMNAEVIPLPVHVLATEASPNNSICIHASENGNIVLIKCKRQFTLLKDLDIVTKLNHIDQSAKEACISNN